VRLPVKLIVCAATVSLIVRVVACTVDENVTPKELLVIVSAPGVVPPNAAIVAKPPALVIVNPPAILAMVPILIVAPAVEPEARVRPKPALVTLPTVKVARAPLPVLKDVAAPRVTVPRFMAVLVVEIVPYRVLEELAVATNPPVKVEVPLLAPIDNVPVLENVVAPATELVEPLIATL
jgi:hypothetical protein